MQKQIILQCCDFICSTHCSDQILGYEKIHPKFEAALRNTDMKSFVTSSPDDTVGLEILMAQGKRRWDMVIRP